MKKYIVAITVIITVLVVMLGLGVANYFTCFAYYLPHKPTVIYMAPEDISAHIYPQFIIVPTGFNQTTVNTDVK